MKTYGISRSEKLKLKEESKVVFEKGQRIAKNALAEDGSIGIRICKDQACAELLKRFRKPLVSTSVNISGQKSALELDEMPEEILSNVDAIYNKEHVLTQRKASQVIKLNNDGTFNILRT